VLALGGALGGASSWGDRESDVSYVMPYEPMATRSLATCGSTKEVTWLAQLVDRMDKTLVGSNSASGYCQVRVTSASTNGQSFGSIDSAIALAQGGSSHLLFFPAAVDCAGVARHTVHGDYYPIPELAAAELAIPIAAVTTSSAPPIAYMVTPSRIRLPTTPWPPPHLRP